MVLTFDENKRMKSDFSSGQSWFQHVGLEKSNSFTYSAKLFSVRRKTKSSSKSVNKTDPSTTDLGNGQDSELGEAEPAEDSDPAPHRLQSSWNDFCLVYCDNCSYHYAHSAYIRHKVIRHVQVLDASIYQHSLYKEKTIPVHDQRKKVKNGRRKTVQTETKNPVKTKDTKNIESKSNVVSNLDVKSGPGYENLECDRVNGTVNSAPGSETLGSEPVNKNVKSASGNGNFESHPINGNGKSAPGNGNRKKKKRKVVVETKNKKPNTGWTSCDDHSSDKDFQDVILKKCQIVTPPKKFNTDHKKESAHKISSGKCVENQEQASICHKKNDAYLEKLGNGRDLKSWKTKSVVKPKRPQIQEKLINQPASPMYNKCLETIKLDPMKIRKALNSINSVLKIQKPEQFQAFSHLKCMMPSSNNNLHQTRVSCWTSPNDHSSDKDFQDVILEDCQTELSPKSFNRDNEKETAHKISSGECVERQEQASIFHKKNDAYLEKLGNGRELKSWKTKSVVKPKRAQIQEKLINQFGPPMYNKCLETIKLDPMKIKKALNSINCFIRIHDPERFRKFSFLQRMMPRSQNFPRRTMVSCKYL